MKTLPKVVFSSTLTDVRWSNARVSDRPVEEEVPSSSAGGQGHRGVRRWPLRPLLARHRLLDEYRLTVHPVALGDGLALLHGPPEPLLLELVSSTADADGAVTHTHA